MIRVSEGNDNDLQFPCPNCDRKFSSARALGGHKRGHTIRARKEAARNQGRELVANGNPSFCCPVCGQSFPLQRSVYGHMRKHSDRGWRGMNPPPASVPDQSWALVLVEGSDEGQERRIRAGKGPVVHDPLSKDDDDLEVSGAYALLLLANGNALTELALPGIGNKPSVPGGGSSRETREEVPIQRPSGKGKGGRLSVRCPRRLEN